MKNRFAIKPLRGVHAVRFSRVGFLTLLAIVSGIITSYLVVASPITVDISLPDSITVAESTNHIKSDSVTQNNPLFTPKATWVQDFTSGSGVPDVRYWNILVGPADNSNKEQQYYTDNESNVRIENGALHLIATHSSQPQGYQYASARLESEEKQSFLYGRIDVTAKLPKGVGTWPAVWMLPANDVYAQKSSPNDPMRYRNGGEIDIIEAVGFQPDIVYGVAHTLSSANTHADGTGSFGTVSLPNVSSDFNKYSLLWTPTSIVFAVNDSPYFSYARQQGADYKVWPFDQPFYMIINLALGGTWGGAAKGQFPGNGIDNSALPASLDIRSIRYYPYIGK